MKIIALSLLLLSTNALNSAFDQFTIRYAKTYASSEDKARRKNIFASNLERAAALNAVNPYAHFGPTQFSDLSHEEFKLRYLSSGKLFSEDIKRARLEKPYKVAGAPCDKIDWRSKNAVAPVKNQGHCGAGWAFAVVANIESQWAIANEKLVEASEQQLVSCDEYDFGCRAGTMASAYQWLLESRGGRIVTEEAYPFVSHTNGTDFSCRSNEIDGMEVAATIINYKYMKYGEDDMVKYSCWAGTLAVGVDASDWDIYQNGIITQCSADEVNHAALIVGFDDTHKPPYWIVKNSWGLSWGEEGFIRLSRGNNTCLIAQLAMIAIVP